MTGEEGVIPVATEWAGAEITHFGRHLGANQWTGFDTAIVVGREELPAITAERQARALWADDAGVTLNLPGKYGEVLRRHDLRHDDASPVEVRVHPDPRVQGLVEIVRERAIGQAVDRLRLIHRDPAKPARVIVLTNLPVPGLTVDRLLPLDDVLEGGTVWERALSRLGGVVPLSVEWLAGTLPDLFSSVRTAKREVANLKGPFGNRYTYCGLALYRQRGQKRQSSAIFWRNLADPRGDLERLLKAQIVEFEGQGDGRVLAQVELREFVDSPAAPGSSSTAPPTGTAPDLSSEAIILPAPCPPDGLASAALFPPLVMASRSPNNFAPVTGLWSVRGHVGRRGTVIERAGKSPEFAADNLGMPGVRRGHDPPQAHSAA